MSAKSATIKAKVENELVELMLRTNVENVVVEEGVTLAAKLAEMVTAINARAKTTDVEAKIRAAIDDLVNGAPAAYDTLKELADYLATHQNEYTALVSSIGGKVDKVSGKGLSTNDFTTALKTKLEGLSNYTLPAATASALGGVKVGSGLAVSSGVLSAPGMAGATASAAGKAGLAPAPAAGAQAKFLRGDGTWQTPTNTTYTVATTAKDGLMSRTDKAALDAKPDVYISASQPANLKANDLWVCVVAE